MPVVWRVFQTLTTEGIDDFADRRISLKRPRQSIGGIRNLRKFLESGRTPSEYGRKRRYQYVYIMNKIIRGC